ncbi:hypothetical protein CEXT_339091 [Caerostris extrusa]|uniref:Uncharacterized protein n=1 Tax=Caerostris extrusa TaxID=172846 RepID=A0AAV4VD50_CAEEX|nr:hypothetical protein CEXT_339091 [Caerostris extrusa]
MQEARASVFLTFTAMAKSLSKSTLTDSIIKWPFRAKKEEKSNTALSFPMQRRRKSQQSHLRGLLPPIKESALVIIVEDLLVMRARAFGQDGSLMSLRFA